MRRVEQEDGGIVGSSRLNGASYVAIEDQSKSAKTYREGEINPETPGNIGFMHHCCVYLFT